MPFKKVIAVHSVHFCRKSADFNVAACCKNSNQGAFQFFSLQLWTVLPNAQAFLFTVEEAGL
jgi:hypothetical protein